MDIAGLLLKTVQGLYLVFWMNKRYISRAKEISTFGSNAATVYHIFGAVSKQFLNNTYIII